MKARIAALLMMALLFIPVLHAQDDDPNAIVYGLAFEPTGIDPHINQSQSMGIVLRQVYDTLIYRDPDTGAFVPGLAESWTISGDELTYTFLLRQDVTFHDGTPFNATAVGTNLNRILDPATASQRAAFSLGPIAGYNIVDDYTIEIELSEPYAPFMDALAQVFLSIASPTALAAYDTGEYQFHQVGTGPFIFEEYVQGDHITLRRNPNYAWGPYFYEPATDDSLQRIEFRFFPDPSTRLLALESDVVQIVEEIGPFDVSFVDSHDDMMIVPGATPGQPVQFLFNIAQAPTDNLLVRQALITAISRQYTSSIYYSGTMPPANGPLTSSTLFYDPAVEAYYPPGREDARALLEDAGYSDADGNGFYDGPDGDLTVTLVVPGWNSLSIAAQLLADQWRDVGVATEIVSVPGFSGILDQVQSGDYNLLAFYTWGMDPVLLNGFFASDGSTNWGNVSDPALDELLIQATQTGDREIRGALYAQIQQMIMDEALILPLVEYQNLTGARRSIENLRFDAYGWHPILQNVTIK